MIQVLVVDDSAYSRNVITRILESIPEVQVVDTAKDGQDALKKTVRLRPDLITLDIEMPHMDGFTFLRWVMTSLPTPVIVVSSHEADDNVFKAMDLGAFDFVVKPTHFPSPQLEDIKADLIEKVLAVPLLRREKAKEKMHHNQDRIRQLLSAKSPILKPEAIGIAASTGGPPAIQRILRDLPSAFDVPIFVAQHMPAGFTSLFARRLDQITDLHVHEAEDGKPVEPGHVYISPGGRHLIIERGGSSLCTRVMERGAEAGYSPSADILFSSLASEMKSGVIGAVLTGMGNDGREGMGKIKQAGGITIAESEKSAVIYGMPREAIDAGVVDHILPLSEIGTALAALCKL